MHAGVAFFKPIAKPFQDIFKLGEAAMTNVSPASAEVAYRSTANVPKTNKARKVPITFRTRAWLFINILTLEI